MRLKLENIRGWEELARVLKRVCGRQGFTLVELLAVMAILSMISVSLFTIFHQGTETWHKSAARTEAYLKARQILDIMARDIRGAVLMTAAQGPTAELDSSGDRFAKRADLRGLNGENPPGKGSSGNSVTLRGWRDSPGKAKEQRYSDQIYFVTPVTNSGRQELCMVGYWVQDVEGDTTAPLIVSGAPRKSKDDVMRRYYLTDGGVSAQRDSHEIWAESDFTEPTGAGFSSELARGVRQLDIKYYDYEYRGGSAPVLAEYNAWDSRPSNYPGSSKERGTTSTKDDDDNLPVAVKITITVADENDIIKGLKLSKIVYLENSPRELADVVAGLK